MSEMRCPQCGSPDVTEPNRHGEVTCFDCRYVFDQDEAEEQDETDEHGPVADRHADCSKTRIDEAAITK